MGKIWEDVSSAGSVTKGLIFPDYNTNRVFYPAEMELGIQDVDLDSGRVTDGTMVRHRKGAKRKLSLTFPPMTTEDLAKVLKAVSTFGTVGVSEGSEAFLRCTYTDPLAGSSPNYRVTKWFYAGDRTSPCYSEALGLWEEMTVEIVER